MLVLALALLFSHANIKAQTTYTWNGSVSTNWNLGANWTPVGIPNPADHVILVAAPNNPILSGNTTIENLTMTSGVLSLGGFTLNAEGVQVFTAGTIQNGTLASTNASSSTFNSTTFAATSTLSINTGAATINGGTFHGPIDINMSGAGNTTGTGNATFNSTVKFTNSGTGYFRTNGNMTFNGATEFVASGSGYLLFELTTGNTYNGVLTLTQTPTSTAEIRMGYNGTTNYNGGIVFNNQSAMTIRFGEQATAINNLNAGALLSIGGSGFTSGNLNLTRFFQLGGTAQNLVLTGTARILINNSSFSGNLNITAPEYNLSNSIYDGVVVFTKTGPLSSNTAGGNTFNQNLTVNHNGTVGYWSFGNGSPDIYNGDVFANNNSQDRIIFGHGSGGNQFNGNVILTQIGSSVGTALTWGAGTATLASTKTITFGGAGFNVGYLYLERVTQLGNAPINLIQTGTSSIYLGPSSTFGGAVNITSPDIYARGATYNSAVVFTKTGSADNHNNGNQNIFNSTLEINQQGTGYFMIGYNSNDLFNENITLSSVNTGGINLGWVNGTGTPTLAAGKTISIGGAGYSQGYLRLGSFTQLGSAPISLSMNGADFYVENLPAPCLFGGNVAVTASNLYIRGGTFNGATSFTKTGSASNHNNGGQNIFNSTLEINQQGTGYFMLGYNSNDLFNDDITVSSTNTGLIYLGYSSGTGTPTLSAGNTILIGGAGFAQGYLYLGDFTQLGNAPINFSMGSAASLTFRNCSIGGLVNATTGNIIFNASVFNSDVSFDKTGANNDASAGGNIFHGITLLENSGSGYLLTGNGAPDIFNDDLTLINNGSNTIHFAYNSAGNIINGDLSIQNLVGAAQVRLVDNLSTLTINGNTDILNNTSSASSQIYYGLNGVVQQNGSVTAVNSASGGTAQILFSNNSGTVLSITGDLDITNNASATTSNVYIGNQGAVNVSGQTTAVNNASGTSGEIYVASGGNSTVTFAGAANFTNSNSGTTKRVWLGNDGDVIFNGILTIDNTATSTNSGVYCNYSSTSSNLYNQNIVVSNSSVDGIRFGQNTGSGVLAALRTITIGGGGYSSGLLYFRNFTQVGPTSQTLLATGTSHIENYNSEWGGNIDFRAGRMLTRETEYFGTAYLEKHGALNDASAGGNIFHGNTELRNSGSGYFLMGNGLPDVFDLNLLMTNSGTHLMYLAHSSAGNSVGGDLTINNTASGADNSIYVVNTTVSSLTIGGNATINNLSSATNSNIYFPTDGVINLSGNLTGTNNGTGATMQLLFANGSSTLLSIGGNTLLTNNGNTTTNRIYLGNAGDVNLTGNLTITNNSSAANSEVFCNYSPTSLNTYGGNIILANTHANGDGIRFGQNTGSGILAATRTVTISGAGFVAGQLYFRNFTQVGATPQTLISTGTTHVENHDSNWGGNVDFRGARMFTRGTIYQGTVYLEKFGALDDASAGGNNFAGITELRNSGSGYFLMGNGNPDIFQTDLVMNNIGTHRMFLAYSSIGNSVGGNLTINNTASGADNNIYVTSSAASTLTISGNAILNNISSAANAIVHFPEAGSINMNGNLTCINNASGATGAIYLSNTSTSILTVGGATQITNSGAGTTKRVFVGNSGDVVFNGTLSILNNSTATNADVLCNQNATSVNAYNQNIVLENTHVSSDGIYFGNGGGFGTLASGQTVSIGGGGFIAGLLQFRNFTQLSATAQSITLTGATTTFENYNSVWNGSVTFIAPRHFTRGTTYNNVSYLEKNGANNDASVGGNIFNGDVNFVVSGTGYFMPSNTTGDDHNANVTYTKTAAGLIYPAYNSTSTYAGNITINSTTTVTFADGGNGRVEFDGGAAQQVSNTGVGTSHIMRRITTNKTGNDVTLNTPINVSNNLHLVTGNVTTSAVNLLIMLAGSNVTSVSDAAYVNGPVRKVGNTAFEFPIGKDGFYRSATISAPGNAAHHFTAEYFFVDPVSHGYNDMSLESPLVYVSDCEYWMINRTNGASNVSVTLSYRTVGINGCSGVVDPTSLRVARWDGSMWRNHGNGGTTGIPNNGTIITSAPVTSFSPFTLATLDLINPLPVELTSFAASCENDDVVIDWVTKSEINNDYFTIEKSHDGMSWTTLKIVEGADNSSVQLDYRIVDSNPYSGTTYYRLKQTDNDGKYEYADMISVHNCNGLDEQISYSVYPNPSNGLVNFNSDFDEEFTIFVTDISGREVLKTYLIKQGTNQLELSDLSSGIYLIYFTVNDKVYTHRISLN
ncbi:MAG: T9SS type A sorting domain-containing protein [Crocinitomicaceae bacterium]|nr:T9SS type A sorting domain-containing protein [Crocinitomicaceae bacterium]